MKHFNPIRVVFVYSFVIYVIISLLSYTFSQDEPDTTRAPFGYYYAIDTQHKGHIYSDCRYIKNKEVRLVATDSVQVCKRCANQLYKEEIESQESK